MNGKISCPSWQSAQVLPLDSQLGSQKHFVRIYLVAIFTFDWMNQNYNGIVQIKGSLSIAMCLIFRVVLSIVLVSLQAPFIKR